MRFCTELPFLSVVLLKKRASRFAGTVLVLGLFVSLQGCVTRGTPIVTLVAPRFVPQSQPDDSIETGISEYPNSVAVFLQWYKTVGASGYNIFRADSGDLRGIPFRYVGSVSNDTTFIDNDSVVAGVRYFYLIQAYALDQTKSDFSDTVHISILSKPVLSYPVNITVDSSNLEFTWKDYANASYTMIRVKDVSLGYAGYVWISKVHDDWYTGSGISKAFNVDSMATGSLASGHTYQWRVDQFNLGTDEQAKSAWETFVIK